MLRDTIMFIGVGIVLIFLAVSFRLFFEWSTSAAIISPLASSVHASHPSPSATPGVKPSMELTRAVETALDGTTGRYGIVIQNLKTGERYGRNPHTVFVTGSLYKLWVIAAVYEQLRAGTIHEDTQLTADIAGLNREFFISPEVAEQTDGTISLTVSEAMDQMIRISDNYSALLLTNQVTVPAISQMLQMNELYESTIGVNGGLPTATPFDIARFYEKLYHGQLGDKASSDAMQDILKTQALNNKIPKYLPDGIEIAHKTGELDGFSHDAGIVYTSAGDYIIVILSQSDDPLLANERISLVSQTVYNYFTQ